MLYSYIIMAIIININVLAIEKRREKLWNNMKEMAWNAEWQILCRSGEQKQMKPLLMQTVSCKLRAYLTWPTKYIGFVVHFHSSLSLLIFTVSLIYCIVSEMCVCGVLILSGLICMLLYIFCHCNLNTKWTQKTEVIFCLKSVICVCISFAHCW